MVLADHAADRGGRPDAGAPFERDDVGIGRTAEQDFGVEEGADVVLHADGEGQFLFQKLPDGDLPLPEDAEGVEADPRLLVDRADDADARPEYPFAGDVVFPQQADAGVGELFEKMLRVVGGLDREGGPGDRLPAQVGDRDDVPVVVQAHRDGIFIGAVDVQGAFLTAGTLGFAAVRLDQQAFLDEIVADGRQRRSGQVQLLREVGAGHPPVAQQKLQHRGSVDLLDVGHVDAGW